MYNSVFVMKDSDPTVLTAAELKRLSRYELTLVICRLYSTGRISSAAITLEMARPKTATQNCVPL